MKTRILAFGVLTLAGWALGAPAASAFSLIPECLRHHHNTCRPYNAFSPVCGYNPRAGGCCPCCGGGCLHGPIQSCLPGYGNMGSMAYQPAYEGAPVDMMPMQTPVPANPEFTPPPPTPNPVFNQTSMQWAPQASYLQPAGYFPGYQAPAPMNYAPMNYYPANNYPVAPPMQVPSYWYGGR